MGGGQDSPRTSEKILEDGTSSYSFDLKYDIISACSINLGSSVLLTGGWDGSDVTTRVSEYNVAGFVRDLPPLQQGRDNHGCSYYDNDDGTKTILVTGGWTGSLELSSTELLEETA